MKAVLSPGDSGRETGVSGELVCIDATWVDISSPTSPAVLGDCGAMAGELASWHACTKVVNTGASHRHARHA